MKRIFSLMLSIIIIVSIFTFVPSIDVNAAGTTIIVHYQRNDEDYDGWNLWIWAEGVEGSVYDFNYEDDFGKVAVINHPQSAEQLGFIVRTDNWDKDVSTDRFIDVNDGFAEIWVYTEKEEFLYEAPDGYESFDASSATVSISNETSVVSEEDSVKVRVHYYRFDENYDGWNLWLWQDGKDGSAYQFNGEDEFGKVATIDMPNTAGVSQIGIIVRLNDWEAKDVDTDRYIQLSKIGDDGILDLYIIQDDSMLYYNSSDVDLSPKFLTASLTKMDSISISVTVPFMLKDSKDSFTITADDGTTVPVKHVTADVPKEYVSNATVITKQPLKLGKNYTLSKEGYGDISMSLVSVYGSKEFENTYYYKGNDLGANYSKSSTKFRLWAPTAKTATILLYEDGYEGDAKDVIEMSKDVKGTWIATVDGDLHGTFYNYRVEVDGKIEEAVDSYAKAVGVNGKRGMVVDLSLTNPEGWENDTKPEFKNFTDAIIYELHIRDLSTDENSGIENVGKYLGLTEKGTTNSDGLSTGLDHIRDLGITHLHLLPVFDYRSINETKLEENNFNWGYDPQNYNVPEGSYSIDPYSGTERIKEFKKMVKVLHENDIRVVMDVVYNHTGATSDSHLNKLVPDYYYRTVNSSFSNGSGCGNETASERAMVRKMIVDSVVYWATEYQIDGFRFDLMGLHDIETMNAIRAALDEIDPTIIIYGEGWTGGSTPLSESKSALKKNTFYMEGIAAFSDDIRDGIKGHVFTANKPGFVNGLNGAEESVKFGIVGATKHNQIKYSAVNYSDYPWADAPSQSINYVTAHDNLTLWDKLAITNPNDSEEDRIKMVKLSNTIVLTSQGIPFLHAGVEMLRTKDGDHNSYKSSDAINQLDWSRKTKYIDVFEYHKGLIEFRKAHPALRMTSTKEIQENLVFFGQGEDYLNLQLPQKNMVGYLITNHANGDEAATIITLFNANKEAKEVTIPKGTWKVYINDKKAGTQVLDTIEGDAALVEGRSSLVLTSDDVVDVSAFTGVTTTQPSVNVETDKEIDEAIEDAPTSKSRVGTILAIAFVILVSIFVFFGIKKYKKG